VNRDGNIEGLHDQDYIHNGKKLINPLDSPVHTLQLGGDIAMLEYIGLVYNKYSIDDHGLKLEDVTKTDRQNWGSVQRICQEKAPMCLEFLRIAGTLHQERTLGMEVYLEVCTNYIDIFCSNKFDLRSHIVMASKVSFFFRLWQF
jgi:hypothetical protein